STTINGLLNLGGVGTSTLGSGINVGAINVTGSSTFNGITLNSGCFMQNGSCLVTGANLAAMYPFNQPSSFNATSTLVVFNGGLTSNASTSIGNGTQSGGLSVYGVATTSFAVSGGAAASHILLNAAAAATSSAAQMLFSVFSSSSVSQNANVAAVSG